MAIDKPSSLTCVFDDSRPCGIVTAFEHCKAELAAVTAERDRLRTESLTTLVACERCGRGVRARNLVRGLCPLCAEDRMTELIEIISGYQARND